MRAMPTDGLRTLVYFDPDGLAGVEGLLDPELFSINGVSRNRITTGYKPKWKKRRDRVKWHCALPLSGGRIENEMVCICNWESKILCPKAEQMYLTNLSHS